MAEHHASVTIHAPVHQVYSLFTHFNDFPKFMSFVEEVTYYDDQRTHWVAQVLRRYEWDAINEDWIEDQQIGWRSIRGLQNSGKVKFRAIAPNQTIVDVYLRYTPPTGALGTLGEHLGVNTYFDTILQRDLNHFARMVEEAPADALDPMSSHYLFHPDSASTKGIITERQKLAMAHDPRMSQEALRERQARIEQEAAMKRETQQAEETLREHRTKMEREAQEELQVRLEREAERRRQEEQEREAERKRQEEVERQALEKLDPAERTIGGRGASMLRTAMGDRDGRHRHPEHEQDPMTSRYPIKNKGVVERSEAKTEEKRESPWIRSIRGAPAEESET